MDYKPATALVTTWHDSESAERTSRGNVLIKPEDLPELLATVATLIARRASRRVERWVRQSRN
jgi:hypothetical protein